LGLQEHNGYDYQQEEQREKLQRLRINEKLSKTGTDKKI
jgi:hypothetical protein